MITRPLRPLPDDFAIQVNLQRGIKALCVHYSTNCRVVSRWLKESGVSLPQRLPPYCPAPADLVENAARMTREALCNHYGIGKKRLLTWLVEVGSPVIASRNASGVSKDAPADFATRAPTMHKMELKRHYKVAEKTINRWLAATGAQAKVYRPTPTGNMRPSRGGGQIIQFRAASVHDLAADVLRRFCPVSRCNERGQYEQAGDFWRVGSVICDGDELLARAERAKRKAA